MNTISSLQEIQQSAESLRKSGKKVAVVPTMGYLHDGHASLIRIARQHADCVITTIFVNPLQFGPNEDYTRYPRDIDRDTKIAAAAGTDLLFTPSSEHIYPAGYLTNVSVEHLATLLEGKFRPTHFKGVTTVVAKLFHLTKPHCAVFGQKDAQQVVIIKKMVKDLNFDIDIIVGPIVREPDGLAMSSRNVYLTDRERKESTVLYRSLLYARSCIDAGERIVEKISGEMKRMITAEPSAKIDYISFAHPTTLEEMKTINPHSDVIISLAVRIGATRLIDNLIVSVS